MTDWIHELIDTASYSGVAVLMLLENIIVPIPAETVMLLAGFVASRGDLSFIGVVAAGTAGSVVGNLPLYLWGRHIGRRRVRSWFNRHSAWLLLEPEQLDRGFDWIAKRRGALAIAMARPLPGVCTLISLPAGAAGMSAGRFLAGSFVGAAIWNTLLATFGFQLGENYRHAERYLGYTLIASASLLVGGIVWHLLHRWRRLHRKPSPISALS
ncbi:DedA family protein [Synoicihabitans lomoniglobus]|uniref:DedA family protein n=1 Tax=Synoicihabitans lomoniglobus TaxID=2909285 RepID=A0AAF0CNQ0_9BACT|nr:DedA family protein [Opitutaceae bacterium LMO-M01]WED64700.1 DedA family protein [Opitutaceae bacterium LMO-M01]